MPLKEFQLAVQACPQCTDTAHAILQNKQQILSAAGGVAGTLALLIQTSSDLLDLRDRLSGEGDAEEMTVEIEREWEEGEMEATLSCDGIRDVLNLPRDAAEDEVRSELEQNVQELLNHDLEDFKCNCKECNTSQASLADFEV